MVGSTKLCNKITYKSRMSHWRRNDGLPESLVHVGTEIKCPRLSSAVKVWFGLNHLVYLKEQSHQIMDLCYIL